MDKFTVRFPGVYGKSETRDKIYDILEANGFCISGYGEDKDGRYLCCDGRRHRPGLETVKLRDEILKLRARVTMLESGNEPTAAEPAPNILNEEWCVVGKTVCNYSGKAIDLIQWSKVR